MNWQHIPVLLNEVLENLITDKDGVYLDGTLGLGGHSAAILEAISEKGKLIALDLDTNAYKTSLAKLDIRPNFTAVNANFANAKEVLTSLNINAVTGALFDLGVSSYQLDDPARGFSFLRNGPLDMRFNENQKITAYDLVNNLDERELADIIFKYGDERRSRAIARAIHNAREAAPITDTQTLASVIEKTCRRTGRTHSATKTFQALRIAVNKELENVENAINSLAGIIAPKGRAAFITFHSIEDRIVKHAFKALAQEGGWKLVHKKPIGPSEEEVKSNPRSRSAKLRVIERV